MTDRSRPTRFAVGLAIAAMLVSVVSVSAWSNGPHVSGNPDPANADGYGTHDWIVDQAVKVLDGRADGWFDAHAARLVSDDPDTKGRSPGDGLGEWHVYREAGRRGGAIQRITELYSQAVADYGAGDYHAASEDLGLLSHYYSDILNPYHSAHAGLGKDASHKAYELLVDKSTKKASDRPEWSSASRSVSSVSNIRTMAIAAAAYSRGKWSALYGAFKDHQSSLSSRASEVTGWVMKRAARDIASIIYSVARGVGEAPAIASLKLTVKYPYVARNEPYQAVYVVAKDAAGHAIEGLEVDVDWPLAGGGTTHKWSYTDQHGWAKVWGAVGASPYMVKRNIVVHTVSGGHPRTDTAWFMATPKLAGGASGYKIAVSDTTVKAGQVVKITTLARDTKGHPVAGLKVTWTWTFGSKTIKTTGTTNSSGKAYSSQTITSSTTHSTVTVTARTQSANVSRSASTHFKRVD